MKIYLDCGSNQGQGFEHFRPLYPQHKVIMFEPNPFMFNILKEKYPQYDIRNVAIWKENTIQTFNFRSDTDFGGSLILDHNSGYLNKDHLLKHFGTIELKQKEVQCIDFSELIQELSKNYTEIIVKMDIESSEYEVISKLIDTGMITKINMLYIEWHLKFFNKQDYQKYSKIENHLKNKLTELKINYENWDE